MNRKRFFAAVLTTGLIASGWSQLSYAADVEPKKEDGKSSETEIKPEDKFKDANPEIVRVTSSYQHLPDGKNQPWKLVRALQLLQDNIAAGKPEALQAYRLLLTHIGAKMLKIPDDYWDIERNLDAVAVFLLIGGDPKIGFKALNKSDLSEGQKMPLRAALAFAERDVAEAYDQLISFDIRVLPISISAQFALAKSMVVSSSDLDLAKKHLNHARLLAPGTLIEEAAIRRAIRIAGEQKDLKEFIKLSHIYMYRFRYSLYFNDFLKNYTYSLVRMPKEHLPKLMKELKKITNELSDDQQITISSYISRHGVLNGNIQLAKWASHHGRELLEPGSKLHARMSLYAAASTVITEETMQHSKEYLSELDVSLLNEDDSKLYNAVKAMAKRMQSEPVDAGTLIKLATSQSQVFPDDLPSEAAALEEKFSKMASENATIIRSATLFQELETLTPGEPQ